MPANAWQVHAEIDRTVCKVDECSRTFAECWEHAKVVAGMKDKEKHATELKKVISLLRQHKTQIRKLTAQNNVPPSSKDKLKDAQARIERDLHRFQEFEQSLGSGSGLEHRASAQAFDGQENVAPVQGAVKKSEDAVNGAAQKGEETSSSPAEKKVQWDQLMLDNTEDRQMIEEFVCKICQVHVVGCGPKLSRCSHLYCGDCIAQWFDAHPKSQSWAQRAQAAGSVPCPVCKEPLKEGTDLFPVCAGGRTESAFLYRMLSGLKVMCANHSRCREDGKCDWTGEYGSIQAHMRGCKNEPLGKPLAAKESRSSAQSQPVAEDSASARGSETEAPSSSIPSRKNTADSEGSSCSSEGAAPDAAAVVDESPDAAAFEPEALPPAAESKPASLTDLLRQLVDLKVQSYEQTRKELPQEESAEDVQECTSPEVTAEPTAQASAAERVSIALPYAASGPAQLSLALGDLVDVLERNDSGWTYGRKDLDASEGWFPSWAIAAQAF